MLRTWTLRLTGLSLVLAMTLGGALSGCSTAPWPDTREYERLQDLGFHAMAETLGDRHMVHESVPLYQRNAPWSAVLTPQDPVAWQFEVVELTLTGPCATHDSARCAQVGLTLRYDGLPHLPLNVGTTQGLVWAVDSHAPTMVPGGWLSQHGQPAWIQPPMAFDRPLLLRQVTFQASEPMRITWRYRSQDSSGQTSAWTTLTSVVDDPRAERSAFCQTVRRAPTQRPTVKAEVLRNDGCEDGDATSGALGSAAQATPGT